MFYHEKGVALCWKVKCFAAKRGVIFKLENKDGYHFFQWVREPGMKYVGKCYKEWRHDNRVSWLNDNLLYRLAHSYPLKWLGTIHYLPLEGFLFFIWEIIHNVLPMGRLVVGWKCITEIICGVMFFNKIFTIFSNCNCLANSQLFTYCGLLIVVF